MAFPIIAAAALGISAISGAIAGANEESERKRRFQDFLKRLAAEEQRRLQEGGSRLVNETQKQLARAKQSGARRAMASGRAEEAESYIQPLEAEAGSIGSEGLREFIRGTHEEFGRARLTGEFEFANRPIQPGFFDYLSTLSGEAGKVFAGEAGKASMTSAELPPTDVPSAEGVNINDPSSYEKLFEYDVTDPVGMRKTKKKPSGANTFSYLSQFSLSPNRRKPAYTGLGG